VRDAALTSETCAALTSAGLDPDRLLRLLQTAFEEDLDERGDLTSQATVDADARLTAAYVSRGSGVAAGLPVLAAVYDVVAPGSAELEALVGDGEPLHPGAVLARVEAPARAVLMAERTSLNLLGHLCGVATLTRSWVDAVAHTGARIRDTRKTIPGLRDLDKYAVRCGGGVNHRRGLFDAYLVKDNHVAAAGGISAALERIAASRVDGADLQVEVDDLDQLAEALRHRPPSVLLDNFAPADLVRAVALIRERSPETQIEASGGLTLDTAAAVAETGVDFLAVGALTHSAPQLDIGLDAG
jgi:nicotinate-nucleotide pyrophosphorylase (carboxylating)